MSSDQRRARQRRREERRLAAQTEAAPVKRSGLQGFTDWVGLHALQIAGGLVGVVLVVVLAYAIYSAATSDTSTGSEAADEAELDDSTDIPGEFHPSEGRSHVSEDVDYSTDPPTSGPHSPVLLPAGIYRDPEQAPEERAVHSMEHAMVVLWYNCEAGGLDEAECDAFVDGLRDKYEDLLRGQSGGGLVVANRPELDTFIALTSWTRLLKLEEYDEEAVDEFIDANRCRFDPEGFCD
ncbi:MAG: DUF3105 domain-containing protein [Dehalococcoidia bacterium]